MKTMIQIAILAAILAPSATFANPHGGKHHPAPPIRNHPPKPTPQPTPIPQPGHHHHHHHHAVVVVSASASAAHNPGANTTTMTAGTTVAPSVERTLTALEFLSNRAQYLGQRVAVFGQVTQAGRGADGVGYYILDGILRCEFPQDTQTVGGVTAGRYVTVTGTATAKAAMVECAQAN